MENVINAIQPKCSFSPFPPVMISQKYWLPAMGNSFLIREMMVVFKVPPICHVLEVKALKTDRRAPLKPRAQEAKETLGDTEEQLRRWCRWQGKQCLLTRV